MKSKAFFLRSRVNRKSDPNRIFDAEALRRPLGGLLERSWTLLEPKKTKLESLLGALEAPLDAHNPKIINLTIIEREAREALGAYKLEKRSERRESVQALQAKQAQTELPTKAYPIFSPPLPTSLPLSSPLSSLQRAKPCKKRAVGQNKQASNRSHRTRASRPRSAV